MTKPTLWYFSFLTLQYLFLYFRVANNWTIKSNKCCNNIRSLRDNTIALICVYQMRWVQYFVLWKHIATSMHLNWNYPTIQSIKSNGYWSRQHNNVHFRCASYNYNLRPCVELNANSTTILSIETSVLGERRRLSEHSPIRTRLNTTPFTNYPHSRHWWIVTYQLRYRSMH